MNQTPTPDQLDLDTRVERILRTIECPLGQLALKCANAGDREPLSDMIGVLADIER
jgi:hypothetical protein